MEEQRRQLAFALTQFDLCLCLPMSIVVDFSGVRGQQRLRYISI